MHINVRIDGADTNAKELEAARGRHRVLAHLERAYRSKRAPNVSTESRSDGSDAAPERQ
jgi:hypothetical protein